MLTEVLILPGCLQLKGSRQCESKSATRTLMLPVFKSLSLVSTPSKTNRMEKKSVCRVLPSKQLPWFQLQTAPALLTLQIMPPRGDFALNNIKMPTAILNPIPHLLQPHFISKLSGNGQQRCCSSLLLHEIYSAKVWHRGSSMQSELFLGSN